MPIRTTLDRTPFGSIFSPVVRLYRLLAEIARHGGGDDKPYSDEANPIVSPYGYQGDGHLDGGAGKDVAEDRFFWMTFASLSGNDDASARFANRCGHPAAYDSKFEIGAAA